MNVTQAAQIVMQRLANNWTFMRYHPPPRNNPAFPCENPAPLSSSAKRATQTNPANPPKARDKKNLLIIFIY
jgi:hypothetical protein